MSNTSAADNLGSYFPEERPRFDRPVKSGGYGWWYIDAMSDDGKHGLTLIWFIGSVFSPYYARARRRGSPDPLDYSSLNVSLISPGAQRWTMTERRSATVIQSPDALSIGPSSLTWEGDSLVASIREVAAPFPRRVIGKVTIRPEAITARAFDLDDACLHRWWPIAPHCHVEVELTKPELRWRGHGYLDCNSGAEAAENGFKGWQWMRAEPDADGVIYYGTDPVQGHPRNIGLSTHRDGRLVDVEMPPRRKIKKTLWGIEREVWCSDTEAPQIINTWETGPFYVRTLVEIAGDEASYRGVHESLSLTRFSSPIVQSMLPFRMPRRMR